MSTTSKKKRRKRKSVNKKTNNIESSKFEEFVNKIKKHKYIKCLIVITSILFFVQNFFGGWEFWTPSINVYSEIEPYDSIVMAPFMIENTGHFSITKVSCSWSQYNIKGKSSRIKSIEIDNNTINIPNSIPKLKPHESAILGKGHDPLRMLVGNNFVEQIELKTCPVLEITVSYKYFFVLPFKETFMFRIFKDHKNHLVWYPMTQSEEL